MATNPARLRPGRPDAARSDSGIGQQGTQWNLMMAASVMAMIPTVLLVVLLQKHLVRGLLVTGLGGR